MKSRIIKLIGNCNNNCQFCMIPKEIKNNRIISFDEFKSIIDSTDKNTQIWMFGGEPTIHPQFRKMVENLTSEDLKFTLASNCRSFSYKNMVKWMKKQTIVSITSSFHGHNPSSHDKITMAKGSFKQSIQGFKNILREKILLQVNIVINSLNINYLEQIIRLLQDTGVKNIKLSGLILFGNMREKENLELVVEYGRIKEKLSKVVPEIKVNFELEKLPLCLLPKYHEKFIFDIDRVPFQKFPECKKCLFVDKCSSIAKNYLKSGFIFEPLPVKNNKF